jgi:crotonobetainyl-CoA:carnitine CoA-transferase CaiB-like acyl-CoA transferase
MLTQLKIIDLSTVLAGPSVATFFAELGAQVIKIENPRMPDVTRSWKLPSENEAAISAYFSSVNYKKEYRFLDLKNPKDYSELMELIETADLLLSNFKKGDDEKLQLTDTILRAKNPRLIHGKITGFGSDSDRVAYDLILQAETGFMSMNGTPESGPVKMPVALIDVLAAHHLKEGLLLALLERQNSTIGKTVSVSLYDAAVCSLANQASNYLMGNHVAQRIGSLHPNIAPYGELFHTKDAQLITFAIGSDLHFSKLCSFLQFTELIDNPSFSTNVARVKHRTQLHGTLQEKIIQLESDAILQYMLDNHVPCGKVKTIDAVFAESAAKELVRTEKFGEQETKRTTSIAFKWK